MLLCRTRFTPDVVTLDMKIFTDCRVNTMESPNFASFHGRWTINVSIERVEKVKRTLLTRDPKQSGGGEQLIVLTTLLMRTDVTVSYLKPS